MDMRRAGRSTHPTFPTFPTLLVATALAAAACGSDATPAGDELPEPSTTTGTNSGTRNPDVGGGIDLTSDDLVGVLAAAAVHRVTVDDSFGGEGSFERVDVIERLAVADSDGSLDARSGRPLTDLERAAITAALAPLPVEFVPASVFDELEPADAPDGRAIVTLAAPSEVDGKLVLTTHLWCGGLCGIGGANELVRAGDGSWSIGEPVGPQVIS